MIKTHNLGYPRIGAKRELKRATESYWKGNLSIDELEKIGRTIREENWKKQRKAGIDLIPVNDFSFYDQMLDMSCLLGNIPKRFPWKGDMTDLNTVFAIARGTQGGASLNEKDCQTGKLSTFASEMTKWFDTNYHYIVPEFSSDTVFKVSSNKVFDEYREAKAFGINAKPVLIGPMTYLALGKVQDSKNKDFDQFVLLDNLLDIYEDIIIRLTESGAEWIQFDEPIFSTDITSKQLDMFKLAYDRLAKVKGSTKFIIATYFGGIRDNLSTYIKLSVDALHFDFVRGKEDLDYVLANFPDDKILSAGIVEGRNIWRNNFDNSLKFLQKIKASLDKERIWLAPSCSLLHCPISLATEDQLDPELKSWMAFSDEKLSEVVDICSLIDEVGGYNALLANRSVFISRSNSSLAKNSFVKSRMDGIKKEDFVRTSDFSVRQIKQREKLDLPEFPTTTIGSFPQTKKVRNARALWKKGNMDDLEYDNFLKRETAECVAFQDQIGIDMPVHGEFERNDMVEYFGEHLDGFAFTRYGWVQSFGTRCVKPPIIFGDVNRPKPITVYWSEYAQSLTSRPMKGMLTGPVTILQWSFVRDDQPRWVTAHQIALAIRDEVIDLETAGLAAIQIDEPAFREGLPLRSSERENYLNWAVKAFRLSSSGVKDDTQIHTHMCYSEFNDIIESIADMDADVITIETSRSNMELLEAFVNFKYPNEIGPGVYDIHSPRVPKEEEMLNLMSKAEAVLPRRNLWVNPDCGLKTREWKEVKPSLINMVNAALKLRGKTT